MQRLWYPFFADFPFSRTSGEALTGRYRPIGKACDASRWEEHNYLRNAATLGSYESRVSWDWWKIYEIPMLSNPRRDITLELQTFCSGNTEAAFDIFENGNALRCDEKFATFTSQNRSLIESREIWMLRSYDTATRYDRNIRAILLIRDRAVSRISFALSLSPWKMEKSQMSRSGQQFISPNTTIAHSSIVPISLVVCSYSEFIYHRSILLAYRKAYSLSPRQSFANSSSRNWRSSRLRISSKILGV